MVPLRIDSCQVGSGWSAGQTRPHLVLQDTSLESPIHRPAVTTKSLPVLRRWESVLFTSAAMLVLLFFLCSFVFSLWRASVVSYAGAYLPSAPIVTVTVTHGQTLWNLAERYGSPDKYILDRVDQIARFNHLSPNIPLFTGQHLRVPVTNPVEIAKMQPSTHVAFAGR